MVRPKVKMILNHFNINFLTAKSYKNCRHPYKTVIRLLVQEFFLNILQSRLICRSNLSSFVGDCGTRFAQTLLVLYPTNFGVSFLFYNGAELSYD